MKKIVRNILIGNSIFTEYPAVSINDNAIMETVFIEIDGIKIEISKTHWLLSLKPMIFGIWFSDNAAIANKKTEYTLHFNSQKEETAAVLEVFLINSIAEKEGTLFLFEVKKSHIYHVKKIKARMIYEGFYRKPENSFTQFRNLAAAFSYPRKVRIISFKKDDYFNIFPMDLVGEIISGNYFVFGLRHTNSTLDKIIETKEIVVAEFPFYLKDEVYRLSNHHSSNPPDLDSLAFRTIDSKLFNFPVPEWTINYKEIKIEKSLNLGSHMLLWGKTTNKVDLNEKENNLFHIHFLNYLNRKNKYIIDF